MDELTKLKTFDTGALTWLSVGFRTLAFEVMKRVSLHRLVWRHHSLGMLQGEINENLRVHIWHPSLDRLGTDSLRRIHDHRFNLVSCIILGSVTNVPIDIRRESETGGGEGRVADLHEIIHSKEQKPGEAVARWLRKVRVQEHPEREYRAGEVYAIESGCFHTSYVSDLAVTLVHRSHFTPYRARVLGDIGEPLRSGIVTYHERPEVGEMVETATKALQERGLGFG